MTIRILPESLINQIAAGEVIERPASVVKELVENAMDSGADQIVIVVEDGGRTLISITDNGKGMNRGDLENSIKRHATSKLPNDDLLNISFMGFRGEALPSIASVSDMTIDTCAAGGNGLQMNCNTGEIRASAWESGTRVKVENLFSKTPARLKFLRSDRAEMMSVVEMVKRLAMARPDVGFTLNNKWRFAKGQPLIDRIAAVMGPEVKGRMLEINTESNSGLLLTGYVSEPTLRRASSIDQYLFVNGRPVKDKVLVGALRAAYMDVMHAREFPLCALYLWLSPREVDVNVSPAKTEVHFLEPARVRGFIIRTLRDVLAQTMMGTPQINQARPIPELVPTSSFEDKDLWAVRDRATNTFDFSYDDMPRHVMHTPENPISQTLTGSQPLGRVIGQIGNKYILAENENGLVIVDQHAAHERIVYEKLRKHEIKVQPLLTPIVISMKSEQVSAIMEIASDLCASGLNIEQFGEDAVAISAKPADWDMDWETVLRGIADEVASNGHSSIVNEKLHLKLANYACHHSVRAGQRLDFAQMEALLRDIESTERAGQCNHGRPVWRQISSHELDGWFERV